MRKIQNREIKIPYWIFTEGHSEAKYFELLFQKLRLPNAKINTIVLKNKGNNWAIKTKRKIIENKIAKNKAVLYLVFDKDDLPEEKFQKRKH
ncbi:hypothetical protein [Mesomycoplasma neurolyticum]|uniref:DUF4435 domain-containing protein n=1 Tax=Mesomycoplasma neurolyticum TaxID=2120 RepID=A0A449A4S0_9BACT|nr:hypothetical protein [Mesomycoplasma neurolyticum]VEU59226.1 Uncharacterised protein [Mesomycoplasma neurolyticum]